MEQVAELRTLLRRLPHGVAVLTVDAEGERLGLTVGSLVSLSLEPPLVGVAISRHAAMHELLREAGGFALSLLGGGSGLRWHSTSRAACRRSRSGTGSRAARGRPARRCSTARSAGSNAARRRVATGDHTFFVGEVLSVELGRARAAARPRRVGVPGAVIDGGRLRSRRGPDPDRGALGRGARGAGPRPRRAVRRRRRSGR